MTRHETLMSKKKKKDPVPPKKQKKHRKLSLYLMCIRHINVHFASLKICLESGHTHAQMLAYIGLLLHVLLLLPMGSFLPLFPIYPQQRERE